MAAVIPGCARLFQVSCRLFFFGGGGFRGVCPHVYISNLRNSSCKGPDQREEEQGVACECERLKSSCRCRQRPKSSWL